MAWESGYSAVQRDLDRDPDNILAAYSVRTSSASFHIGYTHLDRASDIITRPFVNRIIHLYISDGSRQRTRYKLTSDSRRLI